MQRDQAYKIDNLIAELRQAGAALQDLDALVLEAADKEKDHIRRQLESPVRVITDRINERLGQLSTLFEGDAWPALMRATATTACAPSERPTQLAA